MKKTLTILLLVLAITTSLIAGTMAYYTVTLDNLVQGEVTAKDFLMLVKGDPDESITEHLKLEDLLIAPGETVAWNFTVQNYGDQRITETDLYYRLTFSVAAPSDKSLIVPLEVTVLKGGNEEGTFKTDKQQTVDGEFPFKNDNDNKQEQTFTVRVHWPHTDNDSAYIGRGYGATIKVDAIAQQGPFDPFEQPVDPETPGEPGTEEPDDDGEPGNETEGGLIEVVYRIDSEPNHYDNNRFKYGMTITNNTEFDITDWELSFTLEKDTLLDGVGTQIWHASIYKDGNVYKMKQASQWENATIKAGSTISFGGHGNSDDSLTVDDLIGLTLSGTIMENGTTKTVVYETDQIKYTRLP